MATMRSLGFSIFTQYDGSGIRRARTDIDGFNGSVNRSTSALNSWAGRIILATKAAMIFGPALLPIGAHLAAIAASATVMGTSVAAGLAVYGAAMKGAINAINSTNSGLMGLGKNLAEQKTILAHMTPGTTHYAKQLAKVEKAQDMYNHALKAAKPEQKAYVESVLKMNTAWGNFVAINQGKTLATATAGVNGLANGIALLQPLLDAVHPSVLNVAKSFESWTKGDSARQYSNLIADLARNSLPNLVTAGKNLANVLGDGFVAFTGNAESFSRSIALASAKLKAWSDGGGFQRFLQYVKDNAGPVKDFFKALGDALGTILSAMRELGPFALGLTMTILKLVAALPPEWIETIVKGFVAWKIAMAGLLIIQTVIGLVHGLTAAWFVLNLAFSASVIGLVVLAIAALVAGIILLIKNWDTVSNALKTAWNATWNAMKIAVQAVWNALKIAWEAVSGAFVTAWNAVSGALRTAWDAVWNAIKVAVETVWNALKIAWDAFVGGLKLVWDAVSGALSTAWNAVWNALKTAAEFVWTALQFAWNAFLTGVQAIWSAVSTALSAAWNAVWNAIRTAAEAVWNFLKLAWQTFLTIVKTAWDTFSGIFRAAWQLLWNTVKTVAETVWNLIKTAWNTFLTIIRTAWETFSNFFKNSWNTVWNWVKDKGKEIWDWIKARWKEFTDGISEIWDKFSGWIKEKWSEVWNSLKESADKIWHLIGEIIEKAINAVIGIINGLIKGFNKITSFLKIDVEIGTIDKVNLNFSQGGTVGLTPYMNGGISEFAHGGAVNLKGGGALRGYAPGRDTVPAVLSKGEGVLVPEAVRGLGGANFIHGANNYYSKGRAPRRGSNWSPDKMAGKGRRGTPPGNWNGGNFDGRNHFAKGGMVGGVQHFAVGGLTAAALARAGVSLGMITQGEYSNGSLSAGTHLGGGVVDIASTSPAIVAALRANGFAAWARGPAQGMSPHIHAVLMSHPDLSAAARAQVQSFLAGGDGLGVGGGGGGGGIDILGMLKGHIGTILQNVYRGLSPLAKIGGGLADFFGMGGDDDEGNGGLFGTGIGPDVGPDVVETVGNAAETVMGLTGIKGEMIKMLGQMVLSMLDKGSIAKGLSDAKDKFGDFGGIAGGFGEIAVGMGEKILNEVMPDFLMKKKEEAGPIDFGMAFGGGGNVQMWAGLAMQALMRAGIPGSQLGAFLALMAAESGGNPNAINLWDSNAAMNQASRGLMQVIPSTFAAYRDPSLPNNIYDPLANMTAAARYIKARYGGNVPGSPYADGTDNATPGLHLVGEEGPELVTRPGYAMFGGGEQVFTARQTAAMMAPPSMPSLPAPSRSGSGGGDPMGMMESITQASARMRSAVAAAWSEAVSAGRSGQSAMSAAHSGLIREVGSSVPAAYQVMRNSSASTWAMMLAQTATSWAAMRDGTYAEVQMTQGTNVPLSHQVMSASSALHWQKMNVDAAAQWGLMRDTTFTEAGDFISVRMPTWASQMNQGVSTAFQNMNASTAESWSGMEDATRAPVNWIISNAYNNGLARLWNAVAEVIFEGGARTLPTVATLAKGGPVRGPGTSTSDSIPARLSAGEHVWTAKEVRAAGGHGAVATMRSAFLSGDPVQGAVGLARGGWVAGSDTVSGGISYPSIGELRRGFLMEQVGPLLDAHDSGVRGSGLGMNPFRKVGAGGSLSESDWMRQYITKDDEINRGGDGAEWARAQVGKPYVLGTFGSTFDCSTYMSGIATMIRDGVAAPWFTTHPFHGGAQSPLPGWERNLDAPFQIGITSAGIGHTGGSIMGENFEATPPAVRSGPSARGANHSMYQYRYGFAPSGTSGGGGNNVVDPADLMQNVQTFDRGGWIKPGHYAYNGGRRPELATPADEIEKLCKAIETGGTDNGSGECVHVEFNFNGPVTSPDDVRRAADEAIPKLRQAVQSGSGTRRAGSGKRC